MCWRRLLLPGAKARQVWYLSSRHRLLAVQARFVVVCLLQENVRGFCLLGKVEVAGTWKPPSHTRC